MLQVRITRSARKWKLSAGRIRSALPNAEFDHMDGDMAVYHGTDHFGLELELGLVADDKHSDQLRDATRMEKIMSTAPAPFPQRIPADAEISEIDLTSEGFVVGGERLTEARAAEMASRVARGVGRPPLSVAGTTTINFRVETATKTKLAHVAHQQGKRPSDIARLALDKYLAEVA